MTHGETSGETSGAALRRRLARSAILVVPGCADALTARLAKAAGFECLYATGAGIANGLLGVPDVGLTTMTEVVAQAGHICDAVELPVIADVDTGFGNALNVQRTVRAFERAGVAGIQLEDQVFPKRCGHFQGKDVIPAAEMVGKVRAALDARRDASLVVIARTDALAVDGFEAAIDRAGAYAAAGADLVFVEAPRDRDQLAALPRRVPAPLVANMVEGGLTPLLTAGELEHLGYRVVLFANTALRLAAAAVRDGFAELHRSGDAGPLLGRMLGWAERQALVGLPEMEALAARYGAATGPDGEETST